MCGGVVTSPLHTAKVKEPHLLEREGQMGGIQKHYGSVPPLLAAEYRDHGPKHFSKGVGERGMNLAAVVPLALAAMFPWK